MHKPAGLIPAGISDMNTDILVSPCTSRNTNNLTHTQAGSCTNVKQRHEDGDILFDAPLQAAGFLSPAAFSIAHDACALNCNVFGNGPAGYLPAGLLLKQDT